MLVLFLLVAAAQLYVPVKMILGQEDTLDNGTAYKFRTMPVDPNDPFRGKYVALSFVDDYFVTDDSHKFERGDLVYVSLEKVAEGYARVSDLTFDPPQTGADYFQATASYSSNRKEFGDTSVNINFPFDRFYMEESKAPKAEKEYNRRSRDKESDVYALVKVKNGNAVLEDVIVNGASIRKWVEDTP